MPDWESTFRSWARPSSDTEDEKRENAIRGVRAAVDGHPTLSTRTVNVFAHGSYANNTTVRQESDVDIFVLCTDVYFPDFSFAKGFGPNDVGDKESDFKYTQFKNEVEEALVDKFGRDAVTRGKKAFDVHENTYRVDADVVACFEHRRYTVRDDAGRYQYLPGVEFVSDDSKRVVNWPEQHYENGVTKNELTRNRFKQLVRIIKRLRNEMAEAKTSQANPVPSFLIECLVWNVPNEGFGHSRFTEAVRYVLAHLFNETRSHETCKEWREVSELKYLLRGYKPWTLEQTHAFLATAWDHVGFE